MSASNPSRIPFEMMAAGLPVVELYRENNIYDLPNEGVLLAQTSPEAIASSILYLLDNPDTCKKMTEFSINYMKEFPLQKGFEQFLKAVKDMLETDYNDLPKIEKLYKAKPFTANDEVIKKSNELIKSQEIAQNINQDNHGVVYKILRRIYRYLKNMLKK